MRLLLISMLFLIGFSSIAAATPFLHSYHPSNNSFISGGTKTISINVTDDNLNTNSALFHIISLNAYGQGENWDTHILSCVGSSPEWKCSKDLSFVIAGSDTIELFYFEANDTDGITGNNGTATNPLRFTLDRNPPVISFVNPTNNSYVNGNETISLTVTDLSSGVSNNTVQYSLDNSSWTILKNVSSISFESVWNTGVFSNNQTVTMYVKASDNVGNNASAYINVTVDNEVPRIVTYPLSGILSGNVQLQVNVSDDYSGIDFGNVRYGVGSLSGTLGCTGGNFTATCSAVLNTANLQDGNHTLGFNVADRAGNSNSSSIQISTRNIQPTISIIQPTNNAFVKGAVLVRSSLTNVAGLINYVETSVEQGTNTTTRNMACDSGFMSCNFSLNTTSFTDGGYTIRARAMNNSGQVVSSGISVTIDNTKPSLTITQPIDTVRGDFEIKADVIDVNLNQNKVVFNISSFGGSLSCTPQTSSRFICSTAFNSKQLSDGNYSLNVSAEDKAGNLAVASKEITITNQQTSGQSATSGETPVSSPESGTNAEETKGVETEAKGKSHSLFTQFFLSFNSRYVILGVVIIAVLIVVIILTGIVKHRLEKTIITTE